MNINYSVYERGRVVGVSPQKKLAILKVNFHRKYIAPHGKHLSSENPCPPENSSLSQSWFVSLYYRRIKIRA